MRRSWRTRTLAAAAVALAASACVTTDDREPVVAAAEARTGGTLTVAIARPGAIDPANAFDPSAELVARTLCDTLLRTDPATGDVRAGLADSWLVTDDGRQVVLRLRRDLTFSDGTAVTARDVAASLSRAASPAFAGELADLLQPVVGWDELRGIVSTDVARHRRELAGVAAVGEHAVQITLREPDADFVTVLTHPATAPVSATAATADPDGFSHQPVCVGPYVVSEPWNRSSDVITLVRSAHYDAGDRTLTRGGAGWADRIVFRVTDEQPGPGDTTPQVAAPSLRGTDVARVAPPFWDAIDTDPAFTVTRVPGPGIDYVGITVPATDDGAARAARRVLSLAIDRSQVARVVPGRAAATGFLPPTAGPAAIDTRCATAPAGGDPDAARAEADAAGLDLSSLRLVTTGEFHNREVADAVADSWRRVLGTAVEVEVVDWPELQRRSERVDGFDSPFLTSWSSPVPSPTTYLEAIAASSRIGTSNWSRYSDVVTDDALQEDIGAALDREDLLVEVGHLHRRLCERLPLIPVVREVRGFAVRTARIASARADGVVFGLGTALPSLRDLYARG